MPTSHVDRWYPWIAFLVFAVVGAIILWPVPLHPQTLVFAQSGDPFGVLYSLFQSRAAWPALVFPAQPFLVITTTLASRMVGEVAAYNLIIYSGYVLTGFSGYLLGKQLTKNQLAGFFMGLVLTLSPFHVSRSLQHLGLANLQWILFFAWSLLQFDEQPTLVRAALVSLFFIITTLDSNLYGLFALGLLVIGITTKLLWWLCNRKRTMPAKQTILGILLGAIFAILVITPTLSPIFAPATPATTSSSVPIRTISELTAYSAQWFSYVLPSPNNPVFGTITANLYTKSLAASGSNLTELSLYVGWVTIILAAIGIIVTAFNRSMPRTRWLAGTLSLFALLNLWSSFAPTMRIGSIILPTPSQWLYPHLPFLRVYSRFGFAVLIGVSGLAAIGLAQVVRQVKTPRQRAALFLTILILSTAELLALPSDHTIAVDASHLPAAYQALPANQPVYLAEYPLLPGDEPAGYDYLLWDRIHRARLLYSELADSTHDADRRALADPTQFIVVTALKNRGINYLIVHPALYTGTLARKHPFEVSGVAPTLSDPRLVLMRQFSDGTELYHLQ